jgi:hypothetical protein
MGVANGPSPATVEGPFSHEPATHQLGTDRSPCVSARLGDRPLTTVATMLAFSPDRHALQLDIQVNDGPRRVRTGVSQPNSQPGARPAAPNTPATGPTESDHERAYPQADGEP